MYVCIYGRVEAESVKTRQHNMNEWMNELSIIYGVEKFYWKHICFEITLIICYMVY